MISSDVKELVDIVVAYKISIKRVNECRSFAYRQEKMLKWKLEHELDVAYITGIEGISKRFD
jgi:hypothetical protein